MSEDRAVYDVGNVLPESLSAFKSRACVQAYSTGNYVSPTPEEFDRLTKLAGWSQSDVAKLVGVNHNKKGSTTVRKWKTASGAESRTIPYAAWRYLLACAGVISVDDDLALLHESKGLERPTLEQIQALNGKDIAMLSSEEKAVLNFYILQGRKYGVTVNTISDAPREELRLAKSSKDYEAIVAKYPNSISITM